MNATMPRAHLIRLLEIVRTATEAEGTAASPVFAHVRLEAGVGGLHAHAMTTEVAAKACATSASVAVPGAVGVPLRRTLDAARTLAGESVVLALSGGRLALAGDDGAVRLPILPGDDAGELTRPWTLPLDDAATVVVDAARLRSGLLAVRHAVASDESRAAMCGVRLEVGYTGCRLVATDGARLATVDLGGVADRDVGVTLPEGAVEALANGLDGAAGSVQLDLTPDVCRIDADGWAVRAVAIQAVYPPYRDALDRMTPTASASVQLVQLAGLLRRALAAAGVGVPTSLTLGDGSLLVQADDARGQADGRVAVRDSRGEGTVPVNPRFLLAAADALGERTAQLTMLSSKAAERVVAVDLTCDGARCVVVRIG